MIKIPNPKPDENREDFVSRCIPIVLEDGTAETQEQAVAICNSMYEDKKSSYKGLLFKNFSC